MFEKISPLPRTKRIWENYGWLTPEQQAERQWTSRRTLFKFITPGYIPRLEEKDEINDSNCKFLIYSLRGSVEKKSLPNIYPRIVPHPFRRNFFILKTKQTNKIKGGKIRQIHHFQCLLRKPYRQKRQGGNDSFILCVIHKTMLPCNHMGISPRWHLEVKRGKLGRWTV